jgi:hypothetical protein
LAFGENLSFSPHTLNFLYGVVLRVVNLAYAWCHCERLVTHKELITPFTPHHFSDGELHLTLWFNPYC